MKVRSYTYADLRRLRFIATLCVAPASSLTILDMKLKSSFARISKTLLVAHQTATLMQHLEFELLGIDNWAPIKIILLEPAKMAMVTHIYGKARAWSAATICNCPGWCNDAMRCDAIWSDIIRCDIMTIRWDYHMRYNTILYDTIRYDTIRCDAMRCVWCDAIWCDRIG